MYSRCLEPCDRDKGLIGRPPMRLEIDTIIVTEPYTLGFEKLALEVRRIPDHAPSAYSTLRVHDPVPGNWGSRVGHCMQRPADENRAQATVEQSRDLSVRRYTTARNPLNDSVDELERVWSFGPDHIDLEYLTPSNR